MSMSVPEIIISLEELVLQDYRGIRMRFMNIAIAPNDILFYSRCFYL